MTTYLAETTPAISHAARVVRPRAAMQPAVAWLVSSALVLLAWTASVLMTVDGLVRAHVSALTAFAEVSAAALPAIGGLALARRLHRLPAGGPWVWLGVLPSVSGWYFLAQLV